uniref:NAD(P)-binding domain-containing protein n=1 Tax=Haptolina ericina TaxID=156174 RepID=A0A7S3EVG7_9EUKA|mmetsp:Transcript_27544/g.62323  ORF Transcript_27544/g.62323 Transcript_27544/m.62323 type:complete len:693 (+) Transcript_27544:2-2080(+)
MEQVDEVLTCPLTCTASNWPILANRLRIKWVDADPVTCGMCLDDLEAKLSPTTKVIMVVHWGGTPIDLDRIARIQQVCFEKYGFRPQVIEDCAHAFGAEHKQLKLGNHGNLCVFSLQAIKHLTTCDGGLLLLPNAALYERAKLVRWFGIDRNRRSSGSDFRMEPDIPEYGFKYHMNDLNATIGIVNLPHLPKIIAACQANADYFNKELANLPAVSLLPALPAGSSSAWWLYTLRVPAQSRDNFIQMMKEKGVTVSAVHQRNDVHSCVQRFSVLLPKLNVLADELICLPVGWWLTDENRQRIVAAVRDFSQKTNLALMPSPSDAISTRQRKRCIITGGCGFIGHHVVEHFAKNTDYQLIVIDKLSYASKGYDRLRDTGVFHLLQTFCFDLANPISAGLFYELDSNNVEVILHIAAETHVDNSIDTPVPFVENNIKSTLNLLEYARQCPALKHFIYFSTDEVYGSAADGQAFKEGDPHKPSNPYSASKSAAEMICQSYYNTYNVPLTVMNVMNAFGERQHPEKFIPLCINKISKGEPLTIHAYAGATRAGSRWYIHARNIAAAVLFVLKQGKLGEKYNVQGEIELDNLEIAKFVAKELGKELKYTMHDNPSSRPGHDLRYSLDGSKLRDMGWKLPLTFEESLRRTIQWTLANPSWLDQVTFLHMPPADDTPIPRPKAGAAVRDVISQAPLLSKL